MFVESFFAVLSVDYHLGLKIAIAMPLEVRAGLARS
jgi:hypothetical protein